MIIKVRKIDLLVKKYFFYSPQPVVRKKGRISLEQKKGESFSPPEVAALCPSCLMFPSHKPTTKVSRHVPNWGDWRPKSTNLTKSLNSTRATEGTFYRPHVVFWTCVRLIRKFERLFCRLCVPKDFMQLPIWEPAVILHKLSGLTVPLFSGSNMIWRAVKCVKATL